MELPALVAESGMERVRSDVLTRRVENSVESVDYVNALEKKLPGILTNFDENRQL